MIVILFTGGTITMRNDPGGSGSRPGLTPAEILQATRGIRAITAVETEEWGQFPGPHMTVERMWELRNRIVEHLARPEVTGVVITHGTDTLEESAYLVARSTASEKPIVFTGAITKTNTHLLDAFESPGLGPLGVLDEGELIMRREMPPSPPIIRPNSLATPIDIIFAAAGSDARLLDASREKARGLVLAAMGRGNVPPAMVPGIQRWVAEGKPVVLTSRTQGGRVGHTYGYPGGGRRLEEMGAIFGGSRRAQQARIDLMLALGAGLGDAEIRSMFDS